MAAKNKVPPQLAAHALELYVTGTLIADIEQRIGVSRKTLWRLRREHGVPDRARGQQGPAHSKWRGGRSQQADGYVLLWAPEDDIIVGPMRNKSNQVLEHRAVMARHIGRPLTRYETVHHKNGVRNDNRIENLQLRQGQHGNGVVRTCNSCGSHDIKEESL